MADKLASGSTVTVRSDDPTVFTTPDVLSHLAKVVWQDVDGNLAFPPICNRRHPACRPRPRQQVLAGGRLTLRTCQERGWTDQGKEQDH